MKTEGPEHFDSLSGNGVWLFPVTYLCHIAEEYWGGEGFYRWVARAAGAKLTAADFVTLNARACVLVVALIAFVRWSQW